MTNSNLLKSKMALLGDTDFVKCLSNHLNVSRSTASNKLYGKMPFTQVEIITLTRVYGLTAEDIKKIFIGDE